MGDPKFSRKKYETPNHPWQAARIKEEDEIVALNVEAVLMRRLQTMAYLRGLAATPVQARQLIVHGHVAINGRRVNVPGYHVMKTDEMGIEYAPSSPLVNADH